MSAHESAELPSDNDAQLELPRDFNKRLPLVMEYAAKGIVAYPAPVSVPDACRQIGKALGTNDKTSAKYFDSMLADHRELQVRGAYVWSRARFQARDEARDHLADRPAPSPPTVPGPPLLPPTQPSKAIRFMVHVVADKTFAQHKHRFLKRPTRLAECCVEAFESAFTSEPQWVARWKAHGASHPVSPAPRIQRSPAPPALPAQGPMPKKPTSPRMTKAKKMSSCPACGETLYPGTTMAWSSTGWVHFPTCPVNTTAELKFIADQGGRASPTGGTPHGEDPGGGRVDG